jgi:hypothetical protein
MLNGPSAVKAKLDHHVQQSVMRATVVQSALLAARDCGVLQWAPALRMVRSIRIYTY